MRILIDASDRPVVGCAYAADVVVSGDRDLQVLHHIDTTLILSPTAFLIHLANR